GSADIGKLLAQYFKDGNLLIAGADVSLNADETSVVLGGEVDYQEATGCTLNGTLTPNDEDGSVSMVLFIVLADGWTMSQLFESLSDETLKNLNITGASLVIASEETAYAPFSVDLAPGMNLAGTLNVPKSVASIASLIGNPTLPLYGPIDDASAPLFTLQ